LGSQGSKEFRSLENKDRSNGEGFFLELADSVFLEKHNGFELLVDSLRKNHFRYLWKKSFTTVNFPGEDSNPLEYLW